MCEQLFVRVKLFVILVIFLLNCSFASLQGKNNMTCRNGTEIPSPGLISGTQELQQFDLVNILTWDPVINPDPYHEIAAYNIYCVGRYATSCDEANFLTQVPQPENVADAILFYHHNRCPDQDYFYCITSVDSFGNESSPSHVTIEPAYVNVVAPTKVYTSQKLTQFDLTNKLCWDPVVLDFYPALGYNVYCLPHDQAADQVQPCYDCSSQCCSSVCQYATFLSQIPADGPLSYEHHFRCPGVTYDYCISTLAQTGDQITESIIPTHVTVEPTIDPQLNCQCIDCQPLSLVNKQLHGAPIQSVAWLCDTCMFSGQCSCTDNYIVPHPTAAIGGYVSYINACDGATVRVYALNSMTDQLVETAHAMPTSFVYAVNWCCIDGQAFLAVGGKPNELTGFDVWVYKYSFDGVTGNLELIDSFAHGDTIWTVAWLCYDFNDNHTRYLAIGGDPVNGTDIRLLSFNPELKKLSLVTSRSQGATVYSLDWCIRPSRNPMLLAGGKTATENCKHYNFRVYSVTSGGALNLFSSGLYDGGTIRTVKWYFANEKACSVLPYFAVGGDTGKHCGDQCQKNSNVHVYILNPLTHQVRPIAYAQQQERVFSLDWNPCCNSSLVTVGSGCSSGWLCDPNITMYALEKNPSKSLKYRAHSHVDGTISSLQWCAFGDCCYLLAGSEHSNCNQSHTDPFCNQSHDIVLYKSKLCSDEICRPKGICERRNPCAFDVE